MVMPMVKNVEKKIAQIEKFNVCMLSSAGKDLMGNKKDIPQYPYSKKMPGENTVNDWLQTRFYPNYPGLDANVLDVVDIAAAGNMKLKNVRKTYEEK